MLFFLIKKKKNSNKNLILKQQVILQMKNLFEIYFFLTNYLIPCINENC